MHFGLCREEGQPQKVAPSDLPGDYWAASSLIKAIPWGLTIPDTTFVITPLLKSSTPGYRWNAPNFPTPTAARHALSEISHAQAEPSHAQPLEARGLPKERASA